MERLVSVSLILSLSIVYLHFSPVYSSCLKFNASTREEKECIDSFNKITNLEKLEEFLKVLDIGFSNAYFTNKDLSNCLQAKDISTLTLRKFRNLILAANKGDICSGENIEKLVELHPYLSMTIKENKKSRLAPWWEKFVKQTIIQCKSSFLQKLDSIPNSGLLLQGALSLAANLRWQDSTNFIKETVDVPQISADDFVGQDWRAAGIVARTSGKINEILDAKLDKTTSIKNQSKQPKYDVKLTGTEFHRLSQMFDRCNYIITYRDLLFDPVFRLSQLGYDDGALKFDDAIANHKYIHAWLGSIKMCMLLNHVKVLKLASGVTRLKAGLVYKRDNMDELDALGLAMYEPMGIPINFRYAALPKLDLFKQIDEELVEKISGLIKEDDKTKYNDKLSTINKSNIKEVVYSEKFLKLVADFIRSTDAFDPPKQEYKNAAW